MQSSSVGSPLSCAVALWNLKMSQSAALLNLARHHKL